MKKYIFILGIALLLSSAVGFLIPKEHYFRSKSTGAVEFSKIDYEKYQYSKFKTADVDFPLMFLVFFTVLGGGLIISSITLKTKKSKLLNNNIRGSSITPAPSNKANAQNFENIGVQNQIIETCLPLTKSALIEPNTEETNPSVFNKMDVTPGIKKNEKRDWHFTFLIVLGASLVYATIVSMTSSRESFSETRFIGSFFAMSLGSVIIGVLLACFAYLFTKKFDAVNKIIRVIVIVFTILAGSGTLMYYTEAKSDSKLVMTKTFTQEKVHSPNQLFSNDYYSIKYPKGCKFSYGSAQDYINQVIFESTASIPKDYYKFAIGIHPNKYGQKFDKQVFTEICLENTKKLLASYNIEGTCIAISEQQIGSSKAYKFGFIYPWKGLTIFENTYIMNSENYVSVFSFSSYEDEKTELQNEILSSLILK